MGYNTWLTKNGMDSKVFTTTTTPATGGGPIQSISMAGVAPTDSPSMPWGGAVYWNFLTKNLASRGAGIQVLYGTPAQHLVYNPVTQEVIGVEASTSGGSTIYVRANKAVVVACGGFEQDSPRKFNTYFGLNFEFEDNPGSTGDGYAMLEDLGADLWNTVWSSTRLSLDDVHLPGVGAGVSLTMPSTSSTPGGAIKVDQYGSRFYNETVTGAPVLAAVQYWDSTYHLYPRNPSWFIFDEPWRTGATPLGGSVIQSTLGIYAFSTGGVNEIAKGWILKGATLDELAANINAAPNTFTLMSPNNTGLMSANTLKATVSSWNGYCTAGSDPLGRPKATLTAFASTGPYYAAAIFPGAQESYGGARKNGKGQVLRSDGSVIKRAYEAGELGLTSTVSGSPISAMTETAFSGLIAGTNAAAETPWS
jgi:succinate dehydrogenase/fumarate reductase flavoprotein subunit